MDQLQTFLAAVKKYHFWILCVLASLVCLVIVFVSGKKLIAFYDKTKTDISSTDSQLGEVLGRPEHPNQKWIDEVNKKSAEYKKKAYDGWVRFWQQQKKTIFVWPDLGKEFVGYFSFQMDDPAKPRKDRAKMDELSGYYQNYVTMNILPAMAKIINADWAGCDQNANGGGIRGARQPVVNPQQGSAGDHPVSWAPDDQQRLCLAYTWDELPTETEIRCAQEDMWVLKALFEAIARANNGAKVSTDTVVRTVQEVSYGRDACVAAPLGENTNRVIPVGPAAGVAAQAAGPGAPGLNGPVERSAPGPAFVPPPRDRRGRSGRDSSAPGGARRSGYGRSAQPSFVPTPGAEGGTPDPVRDGRYADVKGKCLAWSQVAASTPPEYRLMPFRLVLECDEARFQTVIAELANSVLPLEVREVRINPETQNAGQGARGRNGRPAPVAAAGGVAAVMHNATVEIFGLAYLANPPDANKLKVNEASGNADATANGNASPATTGAGATTTTAGPTTAAPTTATTTTAATTTAAPTNGTPPATNGPTGPAAGTSTTTTASDAATPAKPADAPAPPPSNTPAK